MTNRALRIVEGRDTPHHVTGIKACLLMAMLLIGPDTVGASGDPATQQPCTAPGYRQFDFWLGQWDVFEIGGAQREATATITVVQNGCALRENYRDSKGGGGESLTMYDPLTDVWRQSWISNKGQIVLIAGKKEGDAITLSGVEYGTVEGRLIRGTWTPVKGGVRETAERSSDEGKSWSPWFDIVFRPKSTGAG